MIDETTAPSAVGEDTGSRTGEGTRQATPESTNGMHRQTSQRRFFLTVFVPLVAIYLATATWSPPYDADTLTNVLTANELGTNGDVFLDRHEHLADPVFQGVVSWVVEAKDTAAAQYPPGAAVLAAPLYAVWPADDIRWGRTVFGTEVVYDVPPIAPAAITAAVTVALGVALLGLAIRPLGGDRDALLAAYTVGLATGIWSVAADKLWLHTADVLYLSGGLWLSARFHLAAGLSFGMAALTRPHTAFIGAFAAIGRTITSRSPKPMVYIGLGIGAGLAALLAFNNAVFGAFSISGGYNIEAGRFLQSGSGSFLSNVAGALFDVKRGLFPFSPFLLVLLPGIPAAWRAAPHWVRGSALGGIAYLAVQLASNRFSGGSGFWGYRYPIEMLIAVAPLLFLAYTEWASRHRVAQRLLGGAVALSIGIHAAGALRCAQYLC